ncbi:MAG TPA: TenA family protein [Kiloniellales bacterium]|nr:TenA family protein [Kiloniellales bacterium]
MFGLLKERSRATWRAYSEHAFVRGLADGTLPEPCFRHYLVQDYVFLIHYARAHALAVYKGETVEELRYAAAGVSGILVEELKLHLAYCAKWGLDEAQVMATPEDPRNMAYTRYVLERGLAGDYLDLLVGLAPCTLGYAEIGHRLLTDPATQRRDNPYYPWIESYGGPIFQQLGRDTADHLDRAAERRLGWDFEQSPRFEELARTFEAATRLEVGFWEMGLDAPRP